MKSLHGQLLLSSPSLRDPNFFKSVVLMVQHDKQGALGLVLNRPMEIDLQEAWKQVSPEPCQRQGTLYSGGPCEGVLMALHGEEALSDIAVIHGIYFTTDAQKIAKLMQHPEIPARFFVGYSGWTANQLETELSTGSWQPCSARPEHAFESSEDLWAQIRDDQAKQNLYAGLNPNLIPKDPSMN